MKNFRLIFSVILFLILCLLIDCTLASSDSKQKRNHRYPHQVPVVNLNRPTKQVTHKKNIRQIKTAKSIETDKYLKTTKPVVNSTKPTKPVVYSTKPIKPIKPINSVKSIKSIKPTKSSIALTSSKSTKSLKSSKVATNPKSLKSQKTSKNSSKLSTPLKLPIGKINWIWPVKGPILRRFKQSLHVKGIDIGGAMGQSVRSTAKGIVVYSGSGLKGYGNLIIIKHEQDFLSAYAHNNKLMVKEGDRVLRGQEIAKMGKTDAEKVKLHFEIRYKGNPIDPLKCLP